jgi:hypothetical protein
MLKELVLACFCGWGAGVACSQPLFLQGYVLDIVLLWGGFLFLALVGVTCYGADMPLYIS